MRSLLDPAAKKDSVSSQIGNHRHQHCAAAASFGREKSDKFTVEKSWKMEDFEPLAIRILNGGQVKRRLQNKQPGLLVECCNTKLQQI